MMKRQVDVAIIGAGSAGLSALRQVEKKTTRFVLIDKGPLGTTCARVGCMPSKALIHVARNFHSRRQFSDSGITGSETLSCDIPAVLRHVRSLRNTFAGGMVDATRSLAGDRLILGQATLLDMHRIQVGNDVYEADRIIIATGSSPVVPEAWRKNFGDRILTSDDIFEQETLPRRIAVIGLGAVGLELGQALARLGIQITGFISRETIGGLSDPDVSAAAMQAISAEFPIYAGARATIERDGDDLRVSLGKDTATVDSVLLAMGSKPTLAQLGIENLGLPLDKNGIPPFNPHTLQVGDLPVFIAGDADGCRPILHEALDEGLIAGLNALAQSPECYSRRTPLRIVFCEPQILVAGQSFSHLKDADIVIGSVDFADQSRAMIEGTNRGLLRLYADVASGQLLGAEGACPCAEHFGHMIAWAIQQQMTVASLLQMPFYHPVAEEAIRTALRDAAQKLHGAEPQSGPALCGSRPEPPLC